MIVASAHPWFRAHPVSIENILWHWGEATSDEVEQGLRWYSDAHHVATVIARGDSHLGAGMLAIYSPQQGWIGNVLNAARVLREGKGIGGPGSGMFASAGQKRAADRLLNGERYEDIVVGPKIRDFAHLIEFGGDKDPNDPHVVIDRHALSVAYGHALTSAEYASAPVNGSRRKDGSVSRRHYDHVVSLYRQAAELVSARDGVRVAAHQVQAVTWLVRQRLNQEAEQQRGLSNLDKGRTNARANSERAWNVFRSNHLPELTACPGTGYQSAA
ncbi:DUF7178 family protein [Lentzea cavernae]|uniref:Uncharacterized protein n=1 Tax=Lentzea cavernae TaxID=2020703 RepID=A0ABQ3MW95_9PSEU|nr:hypothetical protein [Lentzea cavernae]GHH62448.1 hypothetical protein GCM10017774_90220 [Lentzea cavernae]